MNRNLTRITETLLSGSLTEWLVFLVVVLGITFAIWAVTRYRASLHGDADPAAEDAQLVRRVREMRDRGEVSEMEYRSLKGRLRPLKDDSSANAAAGVRASCRPMPTPGAPIERALLDADGRDNEEGIDPGPLARRQAPGKRNYEALGGQGRPAGNLEGRS